MNTKATNAAEITRLKKEIASLRKVLKHYIMQVDSLNKLNQTLVSENTKIKERYRAARTEINAIENERNELKDKVSLAAQLDATGFWVTPKNKRGRETEKVKNVKNIAFGFNITKDNFTDAGLEDFINQVHIINYYNDIQKSNIPLEDIQYIMNARSILKR